MYIVYSAYSCGKMAGAYGQVSILSLPAMSISTLSLPMSPVTHGITHVQQSWFPAVHLKLFPGIHSTAIHAAVRRTIAKA